MGTIKLKSLLPEGYDDLEDTNDELIHAYVDKIRADAEKIQKECPVSTKEFIDPMGRKFYRGVKSNDTVIYHDPRGKFRRSKDSNNFSLLYSGIDPDWEDIPKRYSSVCFATTKNIAKEYGNYNDNGMFYVFLVGDPPIAFGKTSDNYKNYRDGFKKTGVNISVDSLDSYMRNVFQDVMPDHPVDLDVNKTPAELKEDLDLLEIAIKNYNKKLNPDIYGNDRVVQSMKKLGVYGFLNTVFDPVLNEIQVRDLSELNEGMGDVEAWSEAPMYLVNEKYKKELTYLLKQ